MTQLPIFSRSLRHAQPITSPVLLLLVLIFWVGTQGLLANLAFSASLQTEETALAPVPVITTVNNLATTTNNDTNLEDVKRIGRESSRHLRHASTNLATDNEIAKVPQPQLDVFRNRIGPIFQRACLECHGPDSQEGNVRVDTLDPNLHIGNDVDWWTEIFAVVSKGEMPPPDSNDLSDEERLQIVEWLSAELQAASMVRRQTTLHSPFRRLTRYEYNYAMQDLLGLPWDFAKDLPPEAHSEDGFQNSSELLHMSVTQFETYYRLARAALGRAVSLGPQPQPLYWGISMTEASRLEWPKQQEQIDKLQSAFLENPGKLREELNRLEENFHQEHSRSYYRNLSNGRTALAQWEYYGAVYANTPSPARVSLPKAIDHVAILPAGQWLNLELGDQLPDEGTLRVRVRASQTKINDSRSPSLQLHFGWQASNEGRALLRVSDQDTVITAVPGSPKFYQWDIPLGEIYPRNSSRNVTAMGDLPSPSEYIRLVNSSASPDEILVDYVDVVAPVYDQWPTPSHQRIFFESANSANENVYAKEIFTSFMTKAWRRTVHPREIDQKLSLFESIRRECDSFEEAIVEVLASVLSSPNFLYIVQENSSVAGSETGNEVKDARPQLSAFELASRLSMFLWCSAPDDELLRLAASNELLDPQVLAKQATRMLDDPRSKRFSKHFVQQWLNLELLDYLNLDEHLPGFDPLLKEAMQAEPIALFNEMMHQNESVLDLVHADYTMANERLARHYGLANVYGNHFRRVPLDGNFRHGGLLTQPGLLAMNSDYPDSHPLKRGKWLLISLLNDPPPPPPPAVPQIDLANPEIAKMTLKERIEDHRNHAACISCHVKIDPWGIAFENYDAIGRWRDEVNGKPVDASSELFNKQTLDGMAGLKRFLLENRQDQLVRALVHKVATYALGRTITFSDRADLDIITSQVRRDGDGLRTLLIAVVTSDLFRSK